MIFNKVKRAISVVFLMVFMAGILPTINVFAEYEGSCGEGVSYSFDESTGELTISGNGRMKDYIDYNESPWNNYRNEIKYVVIKKGVTHIGNRAFEECRQLKSVTIRGSVKTIGKSAFADCANLTLVTIPNGVEEISEYAFMRCVNLKTVVIPKSVKCIGNDAFANCVELNTVIYLGTEGLYRQRCYIKVDPDVFNNCKKLKKIIVPTKYWSYNQCIELEEADKTVDLNDVPESFCEVPVEKTPNKKLCEMLTQLGLNVRLIKRQ